MKLAVDNYSSGGCIGKIDAAIGMRTNQGIITKINDKSLVVKKDWGAEERVADARTSYGEALKYGFPRVANHEQEMKAAAAYWFRIGEEMYNEDHHDEKRTFEEESKDFPPEYINNPAIKAGYQFAKSVAVLRDMAINGLV